MANQSATLWEEDPQCFDKSITTAIQFADCYANIPEKSTKFCVKGGLQVEESE